MAHLRRRGKGWEIIYRHPRLKKYRYRSLPPGTPEETAELRKEEIELRIRKHKLGIEEFIDDETRIDNITLGEFYQKYMGDKQRQRAIGAGQFRRNELALRHFRDVVGADMPLRLVGEYIEEYKLIRFEQLGEWHRRRGHAKTDNALRRGVNKDLVNLKTIFNYMLSKKGLIVMEDLPRFEMYQTDKPEIEILEDAELIRISEALKEMNKHAWLAFQIIRYTGARRGAIVRERLSATNGLKWKDIDWMRNVIRLYDKRKQKNPPMLKELREILIDWKNEHGLGQPDDWVVPLIGDTITSYFKTAMKRAGVKKPGSVHVLRHTLATKLVESGFGVFDLLEWFGWSDPSLAQRYVHIAGQRLQKLARQVNV